MFITQLLNRASSMMWAAIQNKNKTKQNKKKKKNTTTTTTKQQQKKPPKTNKQTNKKHNACSHALSASNVHAFLTLYDGRMKKDKLAKD